LIPQYRDHIVGHDRTAEVALEGQQQVLRATFLVFATVFGDFYVGEWMHSPVNSMRRTTRLWAMRFIGWPGSMGSWRSRGYLGHSPNRAIHFLLYLLAVHRHCPSSGLTANQQRLYPPDGISDTPALFDNKRSRHRIASRPCKMTLRIAENKVRQARNTRLMPLPPRAARFGGMYGSWIRNITHLSRSLAICLAAEGPRYVP